MIPDAVALLVRWISEGLNTTRVSATVLPQYLPETDDGFKPTEGPWIVISCRGGNVQSEGAWIQPSMQVRVWAGPGQPEVARARYLEVFDLLMNGNNLDFPGDGYVIFADEENQGQDVTDLDTGYSTVLSFFALRCTSSLTEVLTHG